MKTVSIRELHAHIGKWVREAAVSREPLVVLDRGRPAARLIPYEEKERKCFSGRLLVDGFDQLPEMVVDSGSILEEDRR